MGLIPISEVAKKYGKSITQVRYAIQQQRLPGTKIGWCWFCDDRLLPDFWPLTPREQIREERGRTN